MRKFIKKRKKNMYDQVPTPVQEEAFKYYFALGKKRSMSVVAEQFGLKPVTLYHWSTILKWRQRISRLETKGFRKARLAMTKDLEQSKKDLQELVLDLIDEFRKEINAGHIKTKNIQDLERVAKLFLLLKGDATEIEQRKVIFEDIDVKGNVIDREGNILEDNEDEEDQKILRFP